MPDILNINAIPKRRIEMKVEIEANVIQATVDYLKKQPFEEVNNLIVALMQSKEITKNEDTNDK